MTQPPRVGVSVGITKNLGDFNSLRVDVQFDRDLREGELPKEAYAKIRALVAQELDKSVEEFTA